MASSLAPEVSSPSRVRSKSVAQSSATAAETAVNLPPKPRSKPVGLKNDYNTCFLNSTFQALAATSALTSLLHASPIAPLDPLPDSILPPPVVAPNQIPSLYSQVLEPPLYGKLPITHAFVSMLQESFRRKDEDGDKLGSTMKLTSLLRAISSKHPHYNEFDQQDAHELLRQLLDSMELEEKDAIKLLQPPPKKTGDGSTEGETTEGTGTPAPGVDRAPSPKIPAVPAPARSAPTTPSTQARIDPMFTAGQDNGAGIVTGQVFTESQTTDPAEAKGEIEHYEGEPIVEDLSAVVETVEGVKLIPFVDVLFGGMLTSVVVCEKCKALSHTYEGFLDISLSIQAENKPRKRDRVFAFASNFASKLIPRGQNTKSNNNSDGSAPQSLFPQGQQTVSDNELSDSETSAMQSTSTSRRRSMGPDEGGSEDGSTSLGRNKTFGGLKGNRLSFRRKRPPQSSSASSSLQATPVLEVVETDVQPATSASPSQDPQQTPNPQLPLGHKQETRKLQPGGPTPAQSAYIARILTPVSGTDADANDPIAKMRAAQRPNGGSHAAHVSEEVLRQETGLERNLREFTSVEVLEGQNAFACQRCWKIKHGKYARHEATLQEEDESAGGPDGKTTPAAATSVGPPARHRPAGVSNPSNNSISTISSMGSVLNSPRAAPPSISIHPGSDSDGSSNPRERGMKRDASIVRARSPLGTANDDEELLSETMANSHMDQSFTSQDSNSGSFVYPSEGDLAEGENDADDSSSESDGLSDSESDTEEEGGNKDKPRKKKSKHYVMGRAFKRYLVAKSPEVLVFHLKRFKALNQTMTRFTTLRKVDDFVSFPEHLDLAPYMAPNRKDYKVSQTPSGEHAPYMEWPNPMQGPEQLEKEMYRLYGVVVHIGDMVAGHYVAYVLVDPEVMFHRNVVRSCGDEATQEQTPELASKDVMEDGDVKNESQRKVGSEAKKDRRIWVFCSDEQVREVRVEEVMNAKAYLCFYEKVRN